MSRERVSVDGILIREIQLALQWGWGMRFLTERGSAGQGWRLVKKRLQRSLTKVWSKRESLWTVRGTISALQGRVHWGDLESSLQIREGSREEMCGNLLEGPEASLGAQPLRPERTHGWGGRKTSEHTTWKIPWLTVKGDQQSITAEPTRVDSYVRFKWQDPTRISLWNKVAFIRISRNYKGNP